MADRVTYELAGSTATITMDDGKVNVLSEGMLAEIDAALDQAGADGAVVVLAGRPGVLSAGFDLDVLRGGGAGAVSMLRAGFETAQATARLLAGIDMAAHAATKLRTREHNLTAVRAAIEADQAEFLATV